MPYLPALHAYVFDSEKYGTAAICEHPQSVRFSGNSTDGSQYVSFPNLGTVVSSNDDFTVEFFFKYPQGDGSANKTIPVLSMNCGLIYNPKDSSKEGAGEPGLFGIMIHGNPDRYFDAYVVDRNQNKARSDAHPDGKDSAYPTVGFADGLWHHAAVVYVKATKKIKVYIDYGVKLSASVERETGKTVLETPEAMLLGNGGFRGLISCLRVSKCARAPETFLRCSSLPTYSGETVFHWSFDNADEIANGILSSPSFTDPRIGQFIAHYKPFRSGYGTVNGFGSGENVVFPVCTNEIPVRRCTEVMSGNVRLISSSNSVAMTIASAEQDGKATTVGTGLRISGNNYDPVNGSFTMEGWFKMDYETWKSVVVDSGLGVQRVALMGVNYGGDYTSADFSLTLVHKSDGFRLKLNVYQANKTYDPAGVNVGEVCRNDAWHHFAVVYEADLMRFSAYLDGAKKHEIVLEAPFVFRSSEQYRELLVGWGLSALQYTGLVDEVRLVRRALSPAEFISFDRKRYGLWFTVR